MPIKQEETHRTTIRMPLRVRESLKAASKASGRSESAIMVTAIEQESRRILGPTMYDRLKDVIGALDSGTSSAARASDKFMDILVEKRENGTL